MVGGGRGGSGGGGGGRGVVLAMPICSGWFLLFLLLFVGVRRKRSAQHVGRRVGRVRVVFLVGRVRTVLFL